MVLTNDYIQRGLKYLRDNNSYHKAVLYGRTFLGYTKIRIAKEEHICTNCGSIINEGEHYVCFSIRVSKGKWDYLYFCSTNCFEFYKEEYRLFTMYMKGEEE